MAYSPLPQVQRADATIDISGVHGPLASPSASVASPAAGAGAGAAQAQKIYLSWENLIQTVVEIKPRPAAPSVQSYSNEAEKQAAMDARVNTRKPCCGGQDTIETKKVLLSDLTGYVEPGQLLAIMGPSGAGKTSLLNALSGRTDPGKLLGNIRYNGLTKEEICGDGQPGAFVEQNDLFYKTLTVREHLMYQAQLRLPGPQAAREARVQQVMQELSLEKAANNRTEGISGGERRRLSFATEILTDPSLLFIDEPTSGLDSFMASQVMLSLHQLAVRGRTVICTIHQPDPSIFKLFHLVLIMNAGRCGYFGPREGCLEYFAAQGHVRKETESHAPFLISLFSEPPKPLGKLTAQEQKQYEEEKAGATHQVVRFVQHFKDTRLAGVAAHTQKERAKWRAVSDARTELQKENSKQFTASWWQQLCTLTSRSVFTLYRDRSILTFRLLQQLFLSLILGMLCFRLDDVQSSIQSRKGAIFFILRFTMFINVLGQLMLFPLEMPIFQREYKAGLYRSDTFFLAKNLAELPGQIVLPIIFMSIAYWMIGFADNGLRFLATLGIQMLITAAAASMGYFLSTLSTSVRGVAEAGSNILTTLMLFDGFLINAATVPSYMRWLGDISIYKWAYEALSIVIWQDYPISCIPASTDCITNGNAVLTSLSFDPADLKFDIAMLVASIVGYRLLSFIFVFAHARRKPVGF